MKNPFLKLAVFTFLFLASVAVSSAQDKLIAQTEGIQLSEEFKFTLVGEVKDSYVLDMSALSFPNEFTAQRYFAAIKGNAIDYSYSYADKKLTVTLMANRYGMAWDIETWNIFFADNAVRYSSYYTQMTK
jgi:hypothetical protein